MNTAHQVPTYPGLVQDLADRGLLAGRWRQVFDAVPRSGFVPADVWRQLPDRCEPVVGTDAWLALVNSDEPVVTQLDDGAEDGPGIATSSNSMPSMVARMLGLLEVQDGQRVLEIGTGTGYVAALLCERLGDDLVHSIELDPVVARQAADALAQAGYRPHLRVGDGEQPWPGLGLVDRLIATCGLAVHPVRPASTSPARRDRRRPARPGVLVRSPGTAPRPGRRHCDRSVPRRSHVHAHARPPRARPPRRTRERPGACRRPGPALLLNLGFALYAGARLPGVRLIHQNTDNGVQVWATREDGAAATAASGEEVWQYGPGFLGEEIEQTWWEYETEGRPDADQFGLTVTDRSQHVWLRDPHEVIRPGRP